MGVTISMATSFAGAKPITREEIDEVLRLHALWLENKEGGRCADLRGYDLQELDLSGVNLSKAILNEAFFYKTKMVGANLSGASLIKASLLNVDFTDATLDGVKSMGSHLCHSKLTRVHAVDANFDGSVMWDNDYTDSIMEQASFKQAQLCDGKFIHADLSLSYLLLADVDYADFTGANLEFANLTWLANCRWATFVDANLWCAFIEGCEFADDAIKGAKGLNIHMTCPEEGSFIAWEKSHDNRLVKFLIPEHALRTGGRKANCRASEVLILDIYEGDSTCEETTGLLGDDKVYRKGETIKAEKFDDSLYHDGEGIHFRLSRADAETIEYKNIEAAEETGIDDEE